MIYGDITRTSFLPSNFDRRYHVVESQDRFLELLENSKPSAIITVNHFDGPRPVLIEDSDFIIPSVTVSGQDGLFLIPKAGATARLKISSKREESTGSIPKMTGRICWITKKLNRRQACYVILS